MEIKKSIKVCEGELLYFSHQSETTNCEMSGTVFIPPKKNQSSLPVLTYLSGLTCTAENFTTKAGAYSEAAHSGLCLVAPDTSPRGSSVPDHENYDLGQGAGFYLNATNDPWASNFKMYDYITKELEEILAPNFSALDYSRQSIMGHSMGGHGALIIGLRNLEKYKSISAFSPIVNPSKVPWGQKAFSAYLREDRKAWEKYDATVLLSNTKTASYPSILIDQGTSDDFLNKELQPEKFVEASKGTGIDVQLRMREGYDHSYFFISTFIGEHIRHHAGVLRA